MNDPISPSPAVQRVTYDEIVLESGGPVVALVLGVANFHGVALIRGLGREDVPVYVLGEPDSLGFYSRYTTRKWVCASPHQQDILLSELEKISQVLQTEGRRAVLFPTSDTQVRILAAQRDKLPANLILHLPEAAVIIACADKLTQCRTAERLGVPLPRTYIEDELPRLQEDLAANRLAFPILFKAREELSPALRKIFRIIVIKDQQRLTEVLASARKDNILFLIQEIIPGADDTLYTLGSCLTKAGEFTAVFTGRKLRQRPPRFGECRVGESKLVEDLIHDGRTLLRGLGFYGISQVEFKYDARDDRYKLIEVNPRAWSWIGLPVAMGINIPYAFFCDALGISIPPYPMPDRRVLWITLYYDLYWSLKEHDGTPWKHLFQSYDQRVESYLTVNDLKPSLIHLKRMVCELTVMFWRQIVKKT